MNIKLKNNKISTKGAKNANICHILSLISVTLFLITLSFTELIYDLSIICNKELLLITGILSISPLLINILEYKKVKKILALINFFWFLFFLIKLLENRNVIYRIYIDTDSNYSESYIENDKINGISINQKIKIQGKKDNQIRDDRDEMNNEKILNISNVINKDNAVKSLEGEAKSNEIKNSNVNNLYKNRSKRFNKKGVKGDKLNLIYEDLISKKNIKFDDNNEIKSNVNLRNSNQINLGEKIILSNEEFNKLEEIFLTPSATIIFYMPNVTIFNELKARSNIIRSFYNDRSSIGARNRLKKSLIRDQYSRRMSGYVKRGIFFIKSKPTEIEIKKLRMISLGRPKRLNI